MSAADLAAIRARAEKHATAYARMLALNGRAGLFGVKEPEMFSDMLAWADSTDNEHADTVLALCDEVERLTAERDTLAAQVERVRALADQYAATHDVIACQVTVCESCVVVACGEDIAAALDGEA